MHLFPFEIISWLGSKLVQLVSMLKSYINHTHMLCSSIQRLHIKLIEKYRSYASFSLLGQQAGWVVGWFDKINGVHLLSSFIQKLHTKFQPNWLKNIKVMQVFHFQAGWLIGWQAGLASWHAQMHMNHIHMLSHSIQRLHTKFQPNRLKNVKVMYVFHFQAGRLVGPVGVVGSQKSDRM